MDKVVIFWSETCGPCNLMKPVFVPALEEIGMKIEMVPVHTKNGQTHAMKYGVMGVPTTLLVRDDIVLHVFQGFNSGQTKEDSKKELLDKIKKYFK